MRMLPRARCPRVTLLCAATVVLGYTTAAATTAAAAAHSHPRGRDVADEDEEGSSEFDFDAVADSIVAGENLIVNSSFHHVQEGHFGFWETVDCMEILHEPSPYTTYDGCYVGNPSAPYGLMLFPPHVDEVPDQYYGFPVADAQNYSSTWHMTEREAIVLLGRTPPECRYFSFTNYLYSRHFPKDWTPDPTLGTFEHACPSGAEADRCEIFASLGDSLNQERGLMLDVDGGVFNTTFALVLSASHRATDLAFAALIEADVPADLISNLSFPGTELTLGLDVHADMMTTLLRTAFYSNQTQADAYFASEPFRLLRMELLDEEDPAPLVGQAPLINRTTGRNDGTMANLTMVEMTNATHALAFDVLQYATNGSTAGWDVQITGTTSGVPDSGYGCIELGERCLGDCRDTMYPTSSTMMDRAAICELVDKVCDQQLDRSNVDVCAAVDDDNRPDVMCAGTMNGLLSDRPDDQLWVVGVNHHATQIASYSSLAIYDSVYLWGVASIGDTSLNGTAGQYARPEDKIDAHLYRRALPFMYVYQFRRHCPPRQSNCAAIPTAPTTENPGFVPLDDPVIFAERMYNNPLSHVGPAVDEVIQPLIIHVKRRER